jgi:hypothetical protein
MASMNIPEEVLEEAARVAWSYEPGASVVEFDRLNPKGRAELIEIAKESTQVVAAWARREALREAADLADARTEYEAPNARLAVEFVAKRIRALAEGDSNE